MHKTYSLGMVLLGSCNAHVAYYNQGGANLPGRCIWSVFAPVCSSVGTVANKTTIVNSVKSSYTLGIIILGLSFAHVAYGLQPRWRHPPWQVHLSVFAPICRCVGIATNMTTIANLMNSIYTLCVIFLGLYHAHIAYDLQPRWHHPPWQVHLKCVCISLQVCGHSDHHDHHS